MPSVTEPVDALVIGAGPAGLMAADFLSKQRIKTVIIEAKPSPARKFLMAGKSGLNLTKNEELDLFLSKFSTPLLTQMLRNFSPQVVMSWAQSLGQEVFTGSSGRVFPTAMKGSPLLRAWLQKLETQGVEMRRNWRWSGWAEDGFAFTTPDGPKAIRAKVCVLALGGTSWPKLGSDGTWQPYLEEKGVGFAPWQPANMGFEQPWSAHIERFFGHPIKGVRLWAGKESLQGEFVISRYGIEGSAIYALSKTLREGADLHIDLLPQLSPEALNQKMAKLKNSESLSNRLRKLGLSPAAAALAMELARPSLQQGHYVALKDLTLTGLKPRPIEEAISVAGGITADSLTPDLELTTLPNVFAAGEMLDWEAPTGGYLLTGCMASGLWAGRAAAERLQQL